MTLPPGMKLGPYEVLALLGAGGMGEVYKAKDTRLARTVAIKVLPQTLSAHPERKARFEREAKAISALNHPHICTLYDVGHQDGVEFLVMEHLEGESLAGRLERGALPLEQALRYGAETAEALDKAHRSGIVHRDLKPGNMMLTKSGVKLLDFGLARLRQGFGGASGDESALTEAKPLTVEGTILGTLQYMAPEQLEGKEADERTDIWALGLVLYEMTTGQKAFSGKSQASLITAILSSEPVSIASSQPMVPSALDRLVRTCLAKDADDRWQSARDLAHQLRWIAEGREEVGATARRGPRALALVLAGALAGLLFARLTGLGRGREADRTPPHVAEAVRFTHEAGLYESPTWSPDGKLVAFASTRSGNFEVYVRRADGGQEVNVTSHPSEDFQPSFSPDGRTIAFVSTRSSRTGVLQVGSLLGMEYRNFGGDLWVLPALGGNARRLAQDANYPTWRPDGQAILYVSGSENRRSLREVSPEGTPLRELLPSADSSWDIVRPQYSPEGLWVSFESLAGNKPGNVLLLPANGGKPHKILQASVHAWADDGSLFFIRKGTGGGTTIGRVALDGRSGLATGSEEVVAVLTGSVRDIAVAPESRALAVSEQDAGYNLTRLPLSADGSRPAGREEALSNGTMRDRGPAYSLDGRRLAYSSDRAGLEEIWVLDLETSRQERLSMPQIEMGATFPTWFPGGNTLAVHRYGVDGSSSLWLVSLDGSSVEELPQAREVVITSSIGVSPDGHRLLVPMRDGPEIQLYELDLVTRKERRVTTTPGDKHEGIWSRDGDQIAYVATTDGTLQLWTQPAAGGEARQLTFGAERMRHASFSPDGNWIYIQPSHRNIWRVPTAGGSLEQVTTFPESDLFLEEPTLAPDGRALAYARFTRRTSIWLLNLAAAGLAGEPPQ